MKFKRFWAVSKTLLWAAGILSLSPCLPAQQNKLAVEPPNVLIVKAGAEAKQVLKVVVVDGFHVNSDKPRDEFLIPLKLTWTSGTVEAKSVTYPKPEELEVGGQKLVVFTGKFSVETHFAAAKDAAKGQSTITGKLRYQACNTEMCFRPSTLEVHLPVVIE